ncbi:hypothetical protein XENOCAPTIV_014712 [Xenoophorus captivus]|uniref:Spt6 SH2 domain-containing protein n=1 Tax=Xenoophorus captivus TaxID=1517983 RepID=A0ABV0QDF2_9TELE
MHLWFRFLAYIKRVIAHPNFHNISFSQAEKMMETLDQGDLIIRPSSKGENHLTVTWKVADGIYQHVDVREEGKENAFSLGHTLWINNEVSCIIILPHIESSVNIWEGFFVAATLLKTVICNAPQEFEDLDEITARYIQPMASFARDLLGHKYFQDCNGGNKEVYVFATPQQPMATPMMTPSYSYTTPSQQPLGTPQYPGSTPQSSHVHAHPHLPHPSHHGPPSGHHGHAPSSSASSSAVDWGKMAEQWLKEKEAEDRKKGQRMTPRPSPSPMIESTPMSLAGDATPLLDEMDR